MNNLRSRFTFPCVTIEQAAAVEADKPETWTCSMLVNAVVDAIDHIRPINKKTLAGYLGLEPQDVTYGLHAVTGMAIMEFMEALRKARFRHVLEQNPSISGKEMAHRLGFSSQGALWTFLTRHKLISPLKHDWSYGNYRWLKQQASNKVKEDIKEEVQRRKWEYLTKDRRI